MYISELILEVYVNNIYILYVESITVVTTPQASVPPVPPLPTMPSKNVVPSPALACTPEATWHACKKNIYDTNVYDVLIPMCMMCNFILICLCLLFWLSWGSVDQKLYIYIRYIKYIYIILILIIYINIHIYSIYIYHILYILISPYPLGAKLCLDHLTLRCKLCWHNWCPTHCLWRTLHALVSS